VIVTEPVRAPAATGAKATLMLQVFVAGGACTVLHVLAVWMKSPVTITLLIVNGAVPVLETVIG